MPLSPITSREAILERSLDADKIIQLYQADFNIDISHLIPKSSLVELYKCPDTGFKFFQPNSIAGDGKFYGELVIHKHSYYTPWKWEHQNALEYLKTEFANIQNIQVLEIGCAEGLFLRKLKDEINTCEVHGIEINEDAIKAAQRNHINIELGRIESFTEEWHEKFDVVISFQVVEHIADVQSFINACLKTLKPGGKFIFGVPNNDSYIFKKDFWHTLNLPPHHMGLWNENSIKSLSNYYPIAHNRCDKEPADLNNLGIYYDTWLKANIPSFRKVLYPLFRLPIKMILRIFKPKYGLTITGIFTKSNK